MVVNDNGLIDKVVMDKLNADILVTKILKMEESSKSEEKKVLLDPMDIKHEAKLAKKDVELITY